MKLLKQRMQKGQTALEYAMVLMVLAIPLAMAARALLDGDGKKNAGIAIVSDAYGDGKTMGIIGRPYP